MRILSDVWVCRNSKMAANNRSTKEITYISARIQDSKEMPCSMLMLPHPTPLELRRLRYDLLLIFTYEIIFGLTDEAAKNMFTLTSSLHYINPRGRTLHYRGRRPTYNLDQHNIYVYSSQRTGEQ